MKLFRFSLASAVFLFFLLKCFKFSSGDHDHIRHILGLNNKQKFELAKKVVAALLMTYRAKKFLLPLPLPIPIPIPVFETYQPVVADPLFFKWLAVKQHFAGHGGLHQAGLHAGLGGFG